MALIKKVSIPNLKIGAVDFIMGNPLICSLV